MTFILYPAIDLKDSQAVRLMQGDMDKSTVYSQSPAKVAKEFEAAGAKWIHVVDLNGAFAGKSQNLETIKSIVDAVDIPVQLGGGIRTMENIDTMLNEVGAQRVILGTVAAQNPELVKKAVEKYGKKIAVGIDAKDGYVAVNGWAEKSEILAVDLAQAMKSAGVQTIIYTDISKDGMMEGPNIEQTKSISDIGGIDVILSGGIASEQDVLKAKAEGFAGAISGKAIYQGTIDLKEVLKLC
ncbi:MAG: 1-(5-phosphoribosyl)-5-[(5-phosphoribosylamino)methylideneamino]imidazole-4-carboxamide isomerase [Eubacteriales bacterium]